jgi:Na+-transporting NADH:ubiquinone oxidoreductase subunit NqrF
LAINEGEDVHSITMGQLRKLSQNPAKFKVVMRVSKNEKEVSSVKSGIEFTRDYFTDRVLTEGEVKNFSRYWICGPPKMSTDTAKNLLKNGVKRESILLL